MISGVHLIELLICQSFVWSLVTLGPFTWNRNSASKHIKSSHWHVTLRPLIQNSSSASIQNKSSLIYTVYTVTQTPMYDGYHHHYHLRYLLFVHTSNSLGLLEKTESGNNLPGDSY